MERRRMEKTQYVSDRRKADHGSQQRSHVPEIQVGQEFDVTIEETGKKGDGIARIEGFVVFVKNSEVGDSLRVKITKVMNTIAFAQRLN